MRCFACHAKREEEERASYSSFARASLLCNSRKEDAKERRREKSGEGVNGNTPSILLPSFLPSFLPSLRPVELSQTLPHSLAACLPAGRYARRSSSCATDAKSKREREGRTRGGSVRNRKDSTNQNDSTETTGRRGWGGESLLITDDDNESPDRAVSPYQQQGQAWPLPVITNARFHSREREKEGRKEKRASIKICQQGKPTRPPPSVPTTTTYAC